MRQYLKLIAFVLILLIGFIPLLLASATCNKSLRLKAFNLFYWAICSSFGLRIKVKGEACKVSPVIFVANHISYLDILLLGAVLPAGFIAKSEIAKWPVIGLMAKLNGSVFIERSKFKTHLNLAKLKGALERKNNLVIFGESTTSDGSTILPFKSSMFKVAENSNITFQPVLISYTKLDDKLINSSDSIKEVCWVGDDYLLPHIWQFFKAKRLEVVVEFCDPITNQVDRKIVANLCRDALLKAKHGG